MEMKEKGKYLKILLKELYEFTPMIFVAISMNILLSTALPLMQLFLSAQVIQWLMDDIAVQEYLIRLLIFIGIVGLAQLGKQSLDIYFEENIERFRASINFKIKKTYLSLDYPLLIGKESQERYNDANELADNYNTLFARIISEMSELGSSVLGVILYISILSQLESLFLVLVSIFLMIVIIFNVLQVRMDKTLFKAKAANTQKQRYLRKVFGESRMTKDIRLFKMKKWFENLEDNTIKEYYHILKPKVKLSWTESLVINIGIIGLSALSYIRSVQLIVTGIIPVSSFIVFTGAVTILAQTIISLVNASGKINTSLNETEKYETFMFQKQVFNHGQGAEIPVKGLSIELKNVTYTYPNSDKPTIDNVSLTITPYENIAIVGENGAGKSTLINLISGLIKPDSGEILINGTLQSAFNIWEYYSLFAPVFQEKFILTYSIKETIVQGLDFDEEKYRRVIKMSGMEKIIQQFEQKDETKIVRAVYADGITLSGGQLQKLKLAQALYKDAPVLLLDEPTAALDPIAEHQVYTDYFNFSKDKLSIFISHRLSSTRFCDRIIYIKEGKITETGTHEQLIANQNDYFKLYEAQAYYYKNDKDNSEENDGLTSIGGVI